MTTFTLIAYRPDHDEYCGGYREGGSSSELEIKVSESMDEIVKHTVDYEFSEKSGKCDCDYADWELTLLIDGKKESWDEEDEINLQHMELRDIYEAGVERGIANRKQEIIKEKERIKQQRIIDEQLRIEKERLLKIQIQEDNKRKEFELFLKLKEKYEHD